MTRTDSHTQTHTDTRLDHYLYFYQCMHLLVTVVVKTENKRRFSQTQLKTILRLGY